MVRWALKNFLLIIAPFVFGSSDLFATTISQGTVADLGREAHWIGRIQVEDVQTIASSAKFPFSRVTAKVLEVLKGSGETGVSVSIQIPGGHRGASSFSVMGFPSFKVGGEYVIFLDDAPRATDSAITLGGTETGLIGWTAFRVIQSDPSKSRMVIRAGEPSLLKGNANTGLALTHDRSIKTYDDFVSEIYRSLD